MTAREKEKVLSLWYNGMPLSRIQKLIPVSQRVFRRDIAQMKREGAFSVPRKTVKDLVVEKFCEGEKNPQKIANMFLISRNTATKYLNRAGYKVGRQPQNYVHCDKTNLIVKDLKAGRLTQAEIAKKHNVSRQYIHKVKRKLLQEASR